MERRPAPFVGIIHTHAAVAQQLPDMIDVTGRSCVEQRRDGGISRSGRSRSLSLHYSV
jgi:hypothetical protein